MVGVIWVIQLLHYPSFHFIEQSNYQKFQNFHMQRISVIVIPVMVIEFVTAFLLVYYLNQQFLSYILLIMLILIWGITFVFFTKIHGKLTGGYDKIAVNKLVLINWSRTILWSFRLLFLLFIDF